MLNTQIEPLLTVKWSCDFPLWVSEQKQNIKWYFLVLELHPEQLDVTVGICVPK